MLGHLVAPELSALRQGSHGRLPEVSGNPCEFSVQYLFKARRGWLKARRYSSQKTPTTRAQLHENPHEYSQLLESIMLTSILNGNLLKFAGYTKHSLIAIGFGLPLM